MDIANKKAVVLGLGNSVLNYSKSVGDITFGVNDIARYHKVDYTIVIDGKARFEDERLKYIVNTDSVLISHLPEWIKGIKRFELIQIKPFSIANMEQGNICYSNNSPFVAMCYAYQKGFKAIDLYGVDIDGHKNLDKEANKRKLINDYYNLISFLITKGVKVNVNCKLKTYL